MEAATLFWSRIDFVGLERLELVRTADGFAATGTVLGLDAGGFRLEHRWLLSRDWRAQSLEVERWDPEGHRRLSVERLPGGWLVDGRPRVDLDGAEEPDLSATPFCNTFPIRRLSLDADATITLDTCYVDADAMTVERSRQRYERLGQNRVRYVDLGAAAGFEAQLDVDDEGLVLRYEHLFERMTPTP